jgi:hypothetical protein
MLNQRSLFRLMAQLILASIGAQSRCQETTTVLLENFDTTAVSSLPVGWRSSQKKLPGTNDWGATSTTTYSAPRAVLATNATIDQWMCTPVIPCYGGADWTIQMMVRRSGTFGAAVNVEVSTDSGRTYPYAAGTILPEEGAGIYQAVQFILPSASATTGSVCVRWRISPETVGASGTFRMDDIRITAMAERGTSGDSVVISEIMYSPRSGDPEWIEILNIGGAPSGLRGWSITDAAKTSRHMIAVNPVSLSPGGFLVLTSDTTALNAAHPIPHGRAVQMSSFPSLNNNGDAVYLFDDDGLCVDSVTYQPMWGGGPGNSLERIDPGGPSTDAANWASSVDPQRATPGRVNSVARRDYDLSLSNVHAVTSASGDVCEISVTIRNAGRQPANTWEIVVADDVDRDSVADADEVVAREVYTDVLAGGDSLHCVLQWAAPIPGRHFMRAGVCMAQDERNSNDGVSTVVTVPIAPGSVSINEIMYEPLTGMPEYIELANVSPSILHLDDCLITDQPTAGGSVNCWKLSGRSYRLKRGGYLTVLSDSSGFSWFPSLGQSENGPVAVMNSSGLGLNNDGDAVVLRSADGVVLDSVWYTPSFHTPEIPDTRGRSLERVNPVLHGTNGGNWGTCVDPSGGTPGIRNSVAVDIFPPTAALRAAPNPFSPDGDGHDDVTVLSYSLPVRTSLLRARIFDIRGRLFRELVNVVPAGTAGNIVWDGRDAQGRRGRIGVYIGYIEAIEAGGVVAVSVRCAIVLAGQLQ